ncbi:hypothetical protein B0J13DRAFT_646956 [Dactylonectria estremocensis]|uniref:BZIP domain-containing protein n=1 Tax=Dactylonectria estremocensis TaxID=1079267 RepID=A0A9P9ILL9_9HYPO|nr:hypothetical protein B0J13DRAFT_646956 [Dactylonectria estremocensis]
MQSGKQAKSFTQARGAAPQSRPVVERTLKAEARSLGEDWSGLASAAERRKIQNRINARAYRKRSKALKAAETPSPIIIDEVVTAVQTSEVSSLNGLKVAMPSPRADLLFSVFYVNVKCGLFRNFALLGQDWKYFCSKQKSSSFVSGTPPRHLPVDLQPTAVQRTVAHDAAIDALPDANLRDRIIIWKHLVDKDELENDLFGHLSAQGGGLGLQGIVIWGEPYLTSSWEITEAFFRKWYFLLSESPNLIASTNHWRKIRGEQPLVLSSSPA